MAKTGRQKHVETISNWLDHMGSLEAAYGTAKSGVGIASMGVMRPDMIMRLGRGDDMGWCMMPLVARSEGIHSDPYKDIQGGSFVLSFLAKLVEKVEEG